jgi:hypothetical protein
MQIHSEVNKSRVLKAKKKLPTWGVSCHINKEKVGTLIPRVSYESGGSRTFQSRFVYPVHISVTGLILQNCP